MKLVKTVLYAFSHENLDDPLSALDEFIDRTDNGNYKYFSEDYESVDIGEWYDDNPLNYISRTKETYERFFRNDMNLELVTSMVNDVRNILATSMYTGITTDEAIFLVLDKSRSLSNEERNAFDAILG